MRNIDFIRDVKKGAENHWHDLLQRLGIYVPDSPRKHAPCPACGGRDRFRFDDEGRGRHICNQCGAGDGLDLIQKVKGCDVIEAAKLAAGAMAMPLPEHSAREKSHADKPIAEKVAALLARTHLGESLYLNNKGLQGPHFLLADGSLALVLRTLDGTITGAQVIHPSGKKRYLSGSRKRGAFISVGDIPERVDTVLITEGYATALSVASLEGGLVLAALDANNLLPVAQTVRQRWSEAEIIIAADNDVAPDGPNVGKEAAEKAALAVSGFITLPPTDYKADWDDYRQQHGFEAFQRDFVANVMLPGSQQTDTPSEKVAPSEENDVVSKLTVIEGGKKAHGEHDPLKPRIESRKAGVYWVEPKMDKDSGKIVNKEQWLCSPLEVVGIGYEDEVQYMVLRWSLMASQDQRTMAIPLADIGEREGWRTLKAGGVNITTKTGLRATLADWLQRCGSRQVWRIAHATGWQYGAYIMPDGEIIGIPEQPVLFRGRSAAASGYKVKGTTESWRENVARLVCGNYSMMTAVAAALAAPLIGLSDNDGFGIHFFEQSSSGKTTTANIASSLYGNPDALRLTWYGTALGLANEAAAHNDALMPLDEVGQGVDPHSVSQSAYALFNGVGKLQGAKEGGNRDLKRWRTIAISTGEMDMETFIASAGKKVKAGQLVRLLNIPLSKAVCFHEYANGKQHADALKDAYQHHYGAAGCAWVKYLADHQQQVIDTVRATEARWRNLIPADYGEQVHRVAARFAVLEAALLLGKVITGWDEQLCRDAIQHSYNAWISLFGTGNKEYEQMIAQSEAFLTAYGFSRYLPYPDSDERDLPIRDLAGYRTGSPRNELELFKFYTFPHVFEDEIAKGFNTQQFARALAQVGMLETGGDRLKKKALKKMGGKQHTFYVLMYSPEDEESQPGK